MIEPHPQDQDPLQQAQRLLQAGDPRAAEAWARQAVERSPRDPGAWMQLGRVLEGCGELGDAVEAFLEASVLAPDDPRSRTALGHLFRSMSMPEEAVHWHGEALSRAPQELALQLNHRFVVPIIPSSTQQIDRFRQRCLEGLEALLSGQQAWLHGSHYMIHHPFYLIYHNCNDRVFLEGYGQLMRSHARAQAGEAWAWQPAHSDRRRTRKRLGFLSGYFSNHSNSLAFEGLIRHLDRRHFEVVVIHLASSRVDATRHRIDALADQVSVINQTPSASLRSLRALDLDVLYYTDIGMNAYSTLLACGRSAPLQMTGWGVPQTSGLTSLDHYISACLVEPEDAEHHYTEQLIRLPGLPCCYLSANLPAVSQERDYFFLPCDALLLGCLQTLWKLHPHFDAALEQIAQRLPEAWFVFIEASITSHTQIFLERIERSAPTLRQRLILLSHQNRQDFVSLASCMDLLLDPPYFSSGVTLYDTLHTGTPIVCLQGAFLRSRYTAAAYKLLQVENPPVAADLQHYVELVVALAGDPQRRNTLRRDLQARAGAHLYDRLDGVRAFEAFVLEAIDRRQPAAEP